MGKTTSLSKRSIQDLTKEVLRLPEGKDPFVFSFQTLCRVEDDEIEKNSDVDHE